MDCSVECLGYFLSDGRQVLFSYLCVANINKASFIDVLAGGRPL